MRAFVTERPGSHRQQSGGPPARRRPRGHRLRQSVHRISAFSGGRAGQSALPPDQKGDLLELDAVTTRHDGADFVFHLAANADVRFGPDHPRRDLEQNTIVTWNVLEAMRARGRAAHCVRVHRQRVRRAGDLSHPETAPFPVQTSLYAASETRRPKA